MHRDFCFQFTMEVAVKCDFHLLILHCDSTAILGGEIELDTVASVYLVGRYVLWMTTNGCSVAEPEVVSLKCDGLLIPVVMELNCGH